MAFCSLFFKRKFVITLNSKARYLDMGCVAHWLFSYLIKGLENCWERHRRVAEYFHRGLEAMGLKLFVKERVSF